MTRTELEERLRALEAQHRADIALMNAAHEARIRSLLSLCGMDPQPVAAPEAPAPVQKPAPKRKRERYSVLNDLTDALPRLPESFDKHDIIRALGYEPPHTTLFRALRILSEEGRIETEIFSHGGAASLYRKLARTG